MATGTMPAYGAAYFFGSGGSGLVGHAIGFLVAMSPTTMVATINHSSVLRVNWGRGMDLLSGR